MRFLRSSLDPEQLRAIRRWFGLHVVVHLVDKLERFLHVLQTRNAPPSQAAL
jgi:hypothetical protein